MSLFAFRQLLPTTWLRLTAAYVCGLNLNNVICVGIPSVPLLIICKVLTLGPTESDYITYQTRFNVHSRPYS